MAGSTNRAADYAVYGRGLCKSFGRKKSFNIVLYQLDITVRTGTIYGLLGPSGCGKTTLLNLIVGVKRCESGYIWVLGAPPGHKNSGVPGNRIGYMPQETALLMEHTVNEGLYYFGRLAGMPRTKIRIRITELRNLLQLPPFHQLVKSLSAGEQKRVSLACTLIHEPSLIIMDEPTVGLDPVLRAKIWDYLIDITENKKLATVIITTHYIEETKQASIVGIMRGGKIVAENPPNTLIKEFACPNLEEVFLKLSGNQYDDLEMVTSSEATHYRKSTRMKPTSIMSLGETEPTGSNSNTCKIRFRRFGALVNKNGKRLLRNPGGLIFSLIFPCLELVVFFTCIGGSPQRLQLGVYTGELDPQPKTGCTGYRDRFDASVQKYPTDCKFNLLSCWFLEDLPDNFETIVYYESESKMQEDVQRGEPIAACLVFTQNYTDGFTAKIKFTMDMFEMPTDQQWRDSIIRARIDQTDKLGGDYVMKKLIEHSFKYSAEVLHACNPEADTRLVLPPLKFEEPIYGDKEPHYELFMAPGVIVTLVFMIQTSQSAALIIAERVNGLWNRNLVCGVTLFEILSSHLVCQMLLLIGQLCLVLLLVYGVYEVKCIGDHLLIFFVLMLESCCGMCWGFLVSTTTDDVITVHYIASGCLYPLLMISGVMWPVEGMNHHLQMISWGTPLTLSIQALRNISEKGWGINDYGVYFAIIVTSIWIIFFRVTADFVMYWRK